MDRRPDAEEVRNGVLTGLGVDDVGPETRRELRHERRPFTASRGKAAWQAVSAAQRSSRRSSACWLFAASRSKTGTSSGRRAVKDRDPDVIGVLAQVVLREGPAVRGAVQVDHVVPERGPHIVEVVGRDGARVEARVGIESRKGVMHPGGERASASDADNDDVSGIAGRLSGIGGARPALVDEDDVTGGVDARVEAREPGEELRAGFAWAAGDGEDGSGRGPRPAPGRRRPAGRSGARPDSTRSSGTCRVPHRPATSALTGISPWTRQGISGCPASSLIVVAAVEPAGAAGPDVQPAARRPVTRTMSATATLRMPVLLAARSARTTAGARRPSARPMSNLTRCPGFAASA